MIFFINGILSHSEEDFVVIEASGVGYKVTVPENVIYTLPELGGEMKVYTYFHVREDQQQLYGFTSIEDKNIFVTLTSVSGVGPKVGIKILSSIETKELLHAILQENIPTLTSVSGVGKKMAERIIIELKDKIPKLFPSIPEPESLPEVNKPVSKNITDDLTLALKTLGYSQDEIRRAIKAASDSLNESLTLEDGIKILLKHL